MSRYAVTGGVGFLGSHLVDTLLSKGHNVVAVDNLVTGSTQNIDHLSQEKRFEFVKGNLAEKFPPIGKVDGIFHLASPASPIDFEPLAVEILKTGSLGTFNAIEYALAQKAWFFMASTSEVYGDPLEHPQSETYLGNVDPIGIRAVYDESKRFSEAVVMAYHRRKELPTSIVRIFNTYGPRMRANDGRVIPNFMSQALRGDPLTVYGDGSQTRSLCYVQDLVEGISRFAEVKPVEPINLGNDREITMRELAEVILKASGSNSAIVEKPLPEGDPKMRCPNISRARKVLSWQPTTSLEKGIERTISYFRDHLA